MTYKPRQRTPFARWMWERGLTPKDLVAALQKSWEAIRTYALDYDDPKRVIPQPATMELIWKATLGEVTPADFYAPPAEQLPADEDWTPGGRFLEAADAP